MIEITNVNKTYGKIKAVDNISLTIKKNIVIGLLGTNGAGKSTLLRMMSGILKPDSGTILIDGEPVWNHPLAKEKFFYISDDQHYFPNATAKEYASFFKKPISFVKS